MSSSLKWDGYHEMGAVTFGGDFGEFDPLLFSLSFLPFVGILLLWRAFTTFRKSNILGRRGKKVVATIIDKTDAGTRNLKWNRITQFQMKIEYEALDEFNDKRIKIEKLITNINHQIWNNISEGYTVNILYDPINPFMIDIDDEYFNIQGRARTGCTKNCCVTLLNFIVAIFFVLIPYWILKASQIQWYWIIVILILIPLSLMVIACVSCCVCCRYFILYLHHI